MKTSHTIKSSLSSGQWHCFTQKEVPLLKKRSIRLARIPKLKSQRKLFGERFAYRAEQSRMMNLVYHHFTEGTTKDLFIEAATEREKH